MASGSPTVNKIERAHQMYREGKYTEALGYYTDALSMAKAKPQKIALHSNRAACYLKLHDFKKAAEECTSVLELDQNHTGALMLRAQTLVTLKEYHSAIFDVNRLIELNPSSEVYRNLQARLKTQMESHLLLYLKMRQSLKKMTILHQMKQNWKKRRTNEKEVLKRWKNVKTKKTWLMQLQKTRKEMTSLNLEPPEMTILRKNQINNLDGRQSQNREDTLILTTPDGTQLEMTLLKKKKKKMMRMKSLSLSIDFVLKLWALRQSNKFPEYQDNCLNSQFDSILKVKLIWD